MFICSFFLMIDYHALCVMRAHKKASRKKRRRSIKLIRMCLAGHMGMHGITDGIILIEFRGLEKWGIIKCYAQQHLSEALANDAHFFSYGVLLRRMHVTNFLDYFHWYYSQKETKKFQEIIAKRPWSVQNFYKKKLGMSLKLLIASDFLDIAFYYAYRR
jgi:hypothetical protein